MRKSKKEENKNTAEKSLDFAFFNFLRWYYISHKNNIRKTYTLITKKFLDYNDVNVNKNAWLRRPQFEALEMYVFIKEYLDNRTMQEIFNLWKNKESIFSDRYYRDIKGATTLYDTLMPQYDYFEEYLATFSKTYPNYIYALTMGLGKTVLMATCIFYEFILAYKYNDDERFCHNALVFAPDKTVLWSLREITTMDKSKVIPPEYLNLLDSNISFYFLNENDAALPTIDNSSFNIIISNTQKIILKHRNKELTPLEKLLKPEKEKGAISSMLSDMENSLIEENLVDEDNYLENQRFEKLKKLDRLGIYVDEAHHLFGSKLSDDIVDNKESSLRNTIDILARDLASKGKKVIACYNYTGTPYIDNKILPEVVYSYGLNDAIRNNYLKDVDIEKYENVKDKSFVRDVLIDFFNEYKGKKYEGLVPKIAIFASEIKEINKLKPIVDETLSEIGISSDKVLVNVGDSKYTSDEEIKDFNNLDVAGSIGAKKQVILLVGKGKEGWNCRSLFGVALYREPKSKVFVLQATMRCLRQITNDKQKAKVYLSDKNYEILDEELKDNFRTSVTEITEKHKKEKKTYKVHVNLPERKIKIKKIDVKYILDKKEYKKPIDFEIDKINLDKYIAKKSVKHGLNSGISEKTKEIDTSDINMEYNLYTLVAEIKRFFPEIKCEYIEKMISECIDGENKIIGVVSKYNDIIYDDIIHKIFDALYEVRKEITEKEEDVILLKKLSGEKDYYEYIAEPNLVIKENDDIKEINEYNGKTFHADTYIFDSKPEKEMFLQTLTNEKVVESYFTGMFTNEKTGFAIPYIDPETNSLRKYYPDFVIKKEDGSYVIIEVKADFMIDDNTVKAKVNATKEIMTDKKMIYMLVPSSKIEKEIINI